MLSAALSLNFGLRQPGVRLLAQPHCKTRSLQEHAPFSQPPARKIWYSRKFPLRQLIGRQLLDFRQI
jgi:hypothetical protein